MKYSIAESARIVGVTRKTFYSHIKKKGISIEKDDDGKPFVDASELMRVYGDKCQFERETTKNTGPGTHNETLPSNKDIQVETAVLNERIKHLEEQRDYFKEQYEREREERQNGVRLLTDQRAKQVEWEKSIQEIREQISNREEGALEELRKFKTETKKRMMAYKRALQTERNKSLWKRLWGS